MTACAVCGGQAIDHPTARYCASADCQREARRLRKLRYRRKDYGEAVNAYNRSRYTERKKQDA